MEFSFIIKDIEFHINGIGKSENYENNYLVLMSIEDFLNSAKYLKNPREESLDFFKKTIKNEIICPPLLCFYHGKNSRVIKHEGRHRALTCQRIGLTHIPVAICGIPITEIQNGYLSQNNKKIFPNIQKI